METRILVAPQSSNTTHLTITSLPLPKGDHCLFLHNNNYFYQIQKFNNELNSYAIGNHIIKDGSLYSCTLYDPLFLILESLEKTKERHCTLHDILYETKNELLFLCEFENINKKLELICDLLLNPDSEQEPFFKINRQKTIEWLKRKCEKVAKLKCFGFEDNLEKNERTLKSVKFIHENITEEYYDHLIKGYGLEGYKGEVHEYYEDVITMKRKEKEDKKQVVPKKKLKPLTANIGSMKKISSFFKKKE
jgi:hypothetical protein